MQKFAREVPRGKVQMQVSELTFSAIPHQSRLFLEYLSDPLSLKRYYPNAVRSPGDAAVFADEVLASYTVDRERLCNALERINRKAGASEAALANIENLRNANCVAVITGQQAGLFSGPLYTIYKALSAVRMAEDLNSAGVNAVPVFWAATEDHDFDEVSKTFVPAAVEYLADESDAGRPVGAAALTSAIETSISDLFASLPSTEFSDELRENIVGSYAEGTGFGTAFLKFIAKIFAHSGLVVIDPMDAEIRQLAAPIISKTIESSIAIGDALSERTRELELDGYAAQVLIEEDHFPLFWIDDDGKRVALRREGDGFRVKGSKTEFTREQLLTVAETTPGRLSPAVMLRPVVQDFLLPTISYFGGAAEVAYFAQNSVVYEKLGRPVTPIFHRQSFTVIESKQRRALDKFGLGLDDLFAGPESVSMQAANELDREETGKLFTEVEERINAELDRLDQRLGDLDVTVATNLATRRRKIVYHLGALKKKALLSTLKKDETAARQVAELFDMLLPYGELQERSLNVLYFLNKYGLHFIDWIYAVTDMNKKAHRIVNLS